MAFPLFYVTVLPSSLTANVYDTTQWGTGGAPLITQVTAAVLTIYLPDPVTKLPSLTNFTTIDLYALGFPITSPVSLSSLDYGQALITDKIPIGVYLYSLAVTHGDTDPPTTTTGVWYGFNYRLTECCADNMSNSRACGCDECLTHKEINLFKMRLNFFAISLNQTYCQSADTAALAIIDAQELCDGRICKSCGC